MSESIFIQYVSRYFGDYYFLFFIVVAPIAGAYLFWMSRRSRVALSKLGDQDLVNHLTSQVNHRGRKWKSILVVILLVMIVLSMARPQWGQNVNVIEKRGVQLIILLDVSQSMLARDVKPDRLGRAKLEIFSIMDKLVGDEVGLVLYAGASFVQFPLTLDYSTARTFLSSANTNVISRQGTSTGLAMEMALSAFDVNRQGQKVILSVSDGENHEGDPLGVARKASRAGIVIYTIGLGTSSGDSLPIYDQNGDIQDFVRDANGDTVVSRLNETILKDISLITGGTYLNARNGMISDRFLGELAKLERVSVERDLETVKMERFQWFLMLAILIICSHELIPDRYGMHQFVGMSRQK